MRYLARMVQGSSRLIRTHVYFSYIGYFYGDSIYSKHKAVEVPSAYHEFDQIVFTDCGMKALFDTGECSLYVDGTQLFNHWPIARAGEDKTINPGGVAVLDGTESYDVDGQIVSFGWEQISGEEVFIVSSDSLIEGTGLSFKFNTLCCPLTILGSWDITIIVFPCSSIILRIL